MKPGTLDTVIRHLKGIVAALEKERTPTIVMKECTNEDIINSIVRSKDKDFRGY